MNKVLLDTNIILDIALAGRPEHAAALLLLDEIEMKEVEACICATSVKDAYYVLCKQYEERYVRAYLRALVDVVETLSVDAYVCLTALSSDEPDVEDGMVRACAERSAVDFVISRDQAAFRKSPVRRLSASEYVELFVPVEEVDLP